MGRINQLITRESQIAPLLATIMHPYCWLFWEFIVDLPMFQHDLLTSLKKAKDKVASLPGGEEALGALEELGSIIVQGPKRKAMEFPPEGRCSFRSEGAGNKQLGAQMRQKRLVRRSCWNLFKMVIFQFAMLVYQRVFISCSQLGTVGAPTSMAILGS